jgi:hypothetical protein
LLFRHIFFFRPVLSYNQKLQADFLSHIPFPDIDQGIHIRSHIFLLYTPFPSVIHLQNVFSFAVKKWLNQISNNASSLQPQPPIPVHARKHFLLSWHRKSARQITTLADCCDPLLLQNIPKRIDCLCQGVFSIKKVDLHIF